MGFKAGIIDERLLDPKYAFEDIEGVYDSGKNDASFKIAGRRAGKKVIVIKQSTRAKRAESSDIDTSRE